MIVPIVSASAIDTLAKGELDLLVEPRGKRLGRHAAALYPMRIVAVGPGAVGPARSKLEVRALDGLPLATLPSDSLVRTLLVEAAASAGIALDIVFESRDPSALVALARDGLCTAVLHDEIRAQGARSRELVHGRRALTVPLWLAWAPDATLSPAARALRDVMLRRAKRHKAA